MNIKQILCNNQTASNWNWALENKQFIETHFSYNPPFCDDAVGYIMSKCKSKRDIIAVCCKICKIAKPLSRDHCLARQEKIAEIVCCTCIYPKTAENAVME